MSRAITEALKKLEKRYGEPMVRKMSDADVRVATISSGRPMLDAALGKGYGVGKIVEIYADTGCGKTGLSLEAVAQVQKDGGKCAIIDMEHALNTEYCEQVGVDVEELFIAQPSYGEQVFEIVRALVSTGEFDLIVVDSVAAMVPKAELEGESGEAKIALQARMMSQGMKLITGSAAEAGVTIMFINQLRSTIAMYGPTETTAGGRALKFYASQRLEVKRKGWIKEGEEVIGFKQHIKVVKNKVGIPFKTVEQDILFGKGVDELTGLIEAFVFEEVLEKAGAWFKFRGVNIAQGIKKLRTVLEDNPDLLDELKEELKKKTS